MMSSKNTFQVADYILFALTMAVPAAIGIYYASAGGKQKTTSEFLLGDRKMRWFPVALSMIASFVSAVALLGNPSEVYTNGTMIIWMNLSYPFVMLISAHVFLPVLYPLGISSVYQYLEMRFSRVLRALGVLTFTVFMILYMAVVLYAPALAVSGVTGFNLWLAILTTGFVCTFYTALGGLKAVVWTDVFQSIVMLAGLLTVLIQGSILQGGFGSIWQIAEVSGRNDFLNATRALEPDPRQRYTVWNLAVGSVFANVGIFVCSQTQFQRAISLPNLKTAQLALWLNWPGMTLFSLVGALCGLVIYANYKDCDPLTSGRITSNDQLLPLFVMDILSSLPGLPGIFLACLFSGSLSTVSSGLNSLAAVAVEDVIKAFIKPKANEKRLAFTAKIIATAFGVLTIGFASLIAYHGGTIIVVVMTILGVLTSPLVAVYTLGLFFPCVNSYGAFCGMLSGMALTLWLQIGGIVNRVRANSYVYPVSTEGCTTLNHSFLHSVGTSELTMTTRMTTPMASGLRQTDMLESGPSLTELYRVSFAWYGTLNFITVIVVGLLVSFLTVRWSRRDVDDHLFSPLVRRSCSRSKYSQTYDLEVLEDKETESRYKHVKENGHVNPAYQ